MQIHLLLQDDAKEWLLNIGEKAFEHCIKQDNAMLALMRIGRDAYNYRKKLEDALAWLTMRGTRAIKFFKLHEEHRLELFQKGQFTLTHLNNREHALAALLARRHRSEFHLKRRRDSLELLRGIPKRYYDNVMSVEKAEAWLVEKARKAVNLVIRKQQAVKKLQVELAIFVMSRIILIVLLLSSIVYWCTCNSAKA